MVTDPVLLLVGHGTISDPADVPEFLRRIRRGRPAPLELVEEIRRRYTHIGRSPLLDVTRELGSALSAALGLPVETAMRFWEPLIENVASALAHRGVAEVRVLPVAPFSVHIYGDAVRSAFDTLAAKGATVPRVRVVAPYGSARALVEAHAKRIAPFLEGTTPETTALVFTAHSLPLHVLSAGDPYQVEFEQSARAVEHAVGFPASLAYQSQGAGGGEWLGPRLEEVLRGIHDRKKRDVVVAPIGFLADHVETLFDLDVEARALADALKLGFSRVPALNADPSLVQALSQVAREAFA